MSLFLSLKAVWSRLWATHRTTASAVEVRYPSAFELALDRDQFQRNITSLIGYTPNDLSIFIVALTHRSILDHLRDDRILSNERLEFLGDAVLDLTVADYLFCTFPEFDEGKLTKLRSQVVNAKMLSQFARRINLGSYLMMSESAESIGVRESDTALSDAYEAIIGAIYLDAGNERAGDFLMKSLLDQINFMTLADTDENYKSALLEYAQANRMPYPLYHVLEESGPSHKKIFRVGVKIGNEMLGYGSGKNKKAAEQLAAREALEKVKPSPSL